MIPLVSCSPYTSSDSLAIFTVKYTSVVLTVHYCNCAFVPFQEYGQNLLASVLMGCLQFLKDGEGNAREESQIQHRISPVTGKCLEIKLYY
jgi:hypothetical protein